jgi:hypothetical protein
MDRLCGRGAMDYSSVPIPSAKARQCEPVKCEALVEGVMRKEVLVHVEASKLSDLNSALQSFAGTPGVTGVTILMIRPA